ncbi:hypothetical protein SANA_32430 [Gottschalkiaceae bacterium SANA]|nr:hypothetical protein SANA_32430 [Gottschalkiaceae bacterium SANA]
MKKWVIIALIIALASVPFVSAFADEIQSNEQEQRFLLRMESNREYIQKLLDAKLITETEAEERLAFLDERIADVMENGFETSRFGTHHGADYNRGDQSFNGYSGMHGRGGRAFGGYGGGFCH